MPLYVFALSGQPAPAFECRGRKVDFVEVGGIFAAATEAGVRPPLNEEALRDQHEIVAAIAARVDAVIPARFGSLVERAELERVMEQRHDAILDALDLVRGREQMTIRVYAMPQPDAPAAPPATTGTAYLQQRKAVAEWTLPARLDEVRGIIRHLVVAERVVRGEGRVQGTIYHLVQRDASAEYSQALEEARPAFPDVPYIVSGPWPPFAFAPELWA